ncbi:MAG: anti-sigma factor family protein [bacterium]
MNCTDCENRFSGYLRDELSLKERSSLEEHLRLCKSCAQSLQAFEVIIANAYGLEKHCAPDHLWAKIEAELEIPQKALHQRLSFSGQSIKHQFKKIFGL